MFVVLASLALAVAASDVLTTLHGEPIDIYRHSQTIGNRGPALLQDQWLLERLQTHNRERIPERNVHARGATALGTFTATADMSAYTMASLFRGIGKKTPIACRWSTVIHGLGSPEYLRDPRGFALKFYTDEGNYDIVGLNFPVFFIRDGVRFPDMIRAFKPNPKTGVQEWWRIYDFFDAYPEAVHMFTWLLDDDGIPRSYRELDGWGIHTFKWISSTGRSHLVRYYWQSAQGVHSFEDDAEAEAQHFSFHTIDLYTNIKNGNFPKWKLFVQMIDENDRDFISSLDFDVLDTTKQWPEALIPLVELGELVFDKNVESQFLENEQIAFSPARLVAGIVPSDEKMLQARLFAYVDTQRYRLGTNNLMLPINRPKCPFRDIHLDGPMNFHDPAANTLSSIEYNYFPSANTNVTQAPPRPADPQKVCGRKVRQGIQVNISGFNDDFKQPRERYESWDGARQLRFAKRVAMSLKTPRIPDQVLTTWLGRWKQVSPVLESNIRAYMAGTTASASASPSPSPTPSPKQSYKSSTDTRAAVTGVVVGIICLGLGVFGGVVWERRNARRALLQPFHPKPDGQA